MYLTLQREGSLHTNVGRYLEKAEFDLARMRKKPLNLTGAQASSFAE